MLDNKHIINNQGRFSEDDLASIWADEKYAAKQAELLRLMMRFKLCYPLEDSPRSYIAPHLLTKNRPNYDWDETDNLLLRYEYKFMPKGIITRFIVVMYHYIEQQPYVWQSGVILAKDGARAEVIEYYDGRELTIRVAGHNKRYFLTAITHELDEIHRSYSRLKYSKLVPCNCSECKNNQNPNFYLFDVLRKFVADGQPSIQCQISYQMVNVRSLIDDIGEQVAGSIQQRMKNLRKIINIKERRLEELKQQKAQKGYSTPPEIVLEIEDIEAEIERLQSELDGLR